MEHLKYHGTDESCDLCGQPNALERENPFLKGFHDIEIKMFMCGACYHIETKKLKLYGR